MNPLEEGQPREKASGLPEGKMLSALNSFLAKTLPGETGICIDQPMVKHFPETGIAEVTFYLRLKPEFRVNKIVLSESNAVRELINGPYFDNHNHQWHPGDEAFVRTCIENRLFQFNEEQWGGIVDDRLERFCYAIEQQDYPISITPGRQLKLSLSEEAFKRIFEN